jgi:hypothetical protein
MSGQARTLYVRVGFYVRPSRTLVTKSVLLGVGGRGSALWFGGSRLGVDAADLASVAPADVADRLLLEAVTSEDQAPMSRDQIRAWQRSWVPQDR